jgi:hypothetical protein
VACRLSANWTLGASHFTKGDYFNGVFALDDTIVLMDNATLTSAINDLQNKLLSSLSDQIKQKSSQFPLGNIGALRIHDLKQQFPGPDYILTHEELSIENLFTNPPFADCDGNISADTEIRWSLNSTFYDTWVAVWISHMQGEVSHHFCPSTSTLEAAGIVFGLLKGDISEYTIGGRTQSMAQKFISGTNARRIAELKPTMIAKLAPLIALLPTAGQQATVDTSSLKLEKIYVENGQLMLRYTYNADLQ